MKARGLALSAAGAADKSAYTHRIVTLAQCLSERSIPCDVFFMADHFPLHKETPASLFMPLWLGMLRKRRFVYCGGEESAQALYFLKPLLSCPVIVDIHGDLNAQSAMANAADTKGAVTTSSPRVRMIDWMGKKVADQYLTVCEPQRNTLLAGGYNPDKISLIRNGVDLELFKPLPQPTEPAYAFAYIGEFQVWQGVELLIEALRRVPPEAGRMLLLGFKPSDAVIKQRFYDEFGDRVELLDRVDRTRMVELIGSVATLIIPREAHTAIRHAFPTKFAEYAAMGRPILVNNVDETAEFVTRYNCGFVSEPDPEAMANSMKHAANSSWEELHAMGGRSRQMAEENFSWNLIGDEYAQVVRRLLHS